MSTTAQTVANSIAVKPTTPNETQNTEQNTHYKVLLTDCKFKVATDHTGSFLGNKVFGHGIHIQDNGNMHFMSGPKSLGGGKLVFSALGGTIFKTGPEYKHRIGSSKSAGQGEGSSDSESSSKKIEAYSEYNEGDATIETHGTYYIKATHIVLDAADTIIIKSGDSILLDTTKLIQTSTKLKGTYKDIEESSDRKESTVEGEEILRQWDTRATTHIITPGNLNQVIGVDYHVGIGGTADVQITGAPAIAQPPLNPIRLNSLNVGIAKGGIAFGTLLGGLTLGASTTITRTAGAGIIDNALGIYKVTSGLDYTVNTPKGVTIAAGFSSPVSPSVGKVNIKSLNETVISAAKDITIESSQGNVDIDGLKIYLN